MRRSLLFMVCAVAIVAAACQTPTTGGGGLAAPGDPVAISGGGAHTCILRDDGTVTCWGHMVQRAEWAEANVPRPMPGLNDAVALASGPLNDCVVHADGSVGCWGGNASGVLGFAPSTPGQKSEYSVTIAGVHDAVDVAVGMGHACALTALGAVWCWGQNANGQLGDGTTDASFVPVAVPGLGAVRDLWASLDTSCAARTDGAVRCWGADPTTLGDPSPGALTPPVAVPALAGAVDVESNHLALCAVLPNGEVRCFGSGMAPTGQLVPDVAGAQDIEGDCVRLSGGNAVCGLLGAVREGASVTAWPGLSDAIAIAGDFLAHCALRSDLSVGCTGSNRLGTMADGSSIALTAPDPFDPPGVSDLVVDVGNRRICTTQWFFPSGGPDAGFGPACLGQGGSRELGYGSTTAQFVASFPDHWGWDTTGIGTRAVAIEVASNHSCLIDVAGLVWCWGVNSSAGQLGVGISGTNPSGPAPVVGLSAVTAISALGSHTCAITLAKVLSCWGSNVRGQIKPGATSWNTPQAIPLGPVVSVAAGWSHTCAVTDGGAVACWGLNDKDQAGVVTPNEIATPQVVAGVPPLVEVVAGAEHTCARTSAGAVWCWGANAHGQAGQGATSPTSTPQLVPGVTADALAVGADHTSAVTKAQGVWCWGANTHGQIGIGSTVDALTPQRVELTGVVGVEAGGDTTCAIVEGPASPGEPLVRGTRCFGWNAFGQLSPLIRTATTYPVAGL